MNKQENIGFIGLGVMGEPMCRNLSTKSGLRFTAFDRREEPLTRLAQVGVGRAASLAEMAASDVVFCPCQTVRRFGMSVWEVRA